jgi:hypothetical protein
MKFSGHARTENGVDVGIGEGTAADPKGAHLKGGSFVTQNWEPDSGPDRLTCAWKPRPKSGLDCLICATFDRQRQGHAPAASTMKSAIYRCRANMIRSTAAILAELGVGTCVEHLNSTFERIRHTQDNQGQAMVLASRLQSLKHFQMFPFRSKVDLVIERCIDR